MRLNVRLPRVEPEREDAPEECPDAGCGGRHFRAHGIRGEPKALRDPQISELVAYRYRCLKCGRIFRSYPGGVTRGQQSDRLKAISVLLCVLGLSHGAVEDLLTALGVPLAKVTVYENVQGADLAARECPGSS